MYQDVKALTGNIIDEDIMDDPIMLNLISVEEEPMSSDIQLDKKEDKDDDGALLRDVESIDTVTFNPKDATKDENLNDFKNTGECFMSYGQSKNEYYMLPASFFNNFDNLRLLGKCCPLSITLYDFKKYAGVDCFKREIEHKTVHETNLNVTSNNKIMKLQKMEENSNKNKDSVIIETILDETITNVIIKINENFHDSFHQNINISCDDRIIQSFDTNTVTNVAPKCSSTISNTLSNTSLISRKIQPIDDTTEDEKKNPQQIDDVYIGLCTIFQKDFPVPESLPKIDDIEECLTTGDKLVDKINSKNIFKTTNTSSIEISPAKRHHENKVYNNVSMDDITKTISPKSNLNNTKRDADDNTMQKQKAISVSKIKENYERFLLKHLVKSKTSLKRKKENLKIVNEMKGKDKFQNYIDNCTSKLNSHKKCTHSVTCNNIFTQDLPKKFNNKNVKEETIVKLNKTNKNNHNVLNLNVNFPDISNIPIGSCNNISIKKGLKRKLDHKSVHTKVEPKEESCVDVISNKISYLFKEFDESRRIKRDQKQYLANNSSKEDTQVVEKNIENANTSNKVKNITLNTNNYILNDNNIGITKYITSNNNNNHISKDVLNSSDTNFNDADQNKMKPESNIYKQKRLFINPCVIKDDANNFGDNKLVKPVIKCSIPKQNLIEKNPIAIKNVNFGYLSSSNKFNISRFHPFKQDKSQNYLLAAFETNNNERKSTGMFDQITAQKTKKSFTKKEAEQFVEILSIPLAEELPNYSKNKHKILHNLSSVIVQDKPLNITKTANEPKIMANENKNTSKLLTDVKHNITSTASYSVSQIPTHVTSYRSPIIIARVSARGPYPTTYCHSEAQEPTFAAPNNKLLPHLKHHQIKLPQYVDPCNANTINAHSNHNLLPDTPPYNLTYTQSPIPPGIQFNHFNNSHYLPPYLSYHEPRTCPSNISNYFQTKNKIYDNNPINLKTSEATGYTNKNNSLYNIHNLELRPKTKKIQYNSCAIHYNLKNSATDAPTLQGYSKEVISDLKDNLNNTGDPNESTNKIHLSVPKTNVKVTLKDINTVHPSYKSTDKYRSKPVNTIYKIQKSRCISMNNGHSNTRKVYLIRNSSTPFKHLPMTRNTVDGDGIHFYKNSLDSIEKITTDKKIDASISVYRKTTINRYDMNLKHEIPESKIIRNKNNSCRGKKLINKAPCLKDNNKYRTEVKNRISKYVELSNRIKINRIPWTDHKSKDGNGKEEICDLTDE